MKFFDNILQTVFPGDTCSKKKTRTEFEIAVYLESIFVLKEYLKDPNFDPTYHNGIILTDAILAGKNKSALLLAQDSRFTHVLIKHDFHLAVLFTMCWEVFQILLRNQPDSDRLLHVATNHYLLKLDNFSMRNENANFIYTNILNRQYQQRFAQKSLFQLINKDTIAMCIGLLSLDIPDLLLTSIAEFACQPWCNNVDYHNVYNCCRLTNFFSKHFDQCGKSDLILKKHPNVLIGVSAEFFQVPERFIAPPQSLVRL